MRQELKHHQHFAPLNKNVLESDQVRVIVFVEFGQSRDLPQQVRRHALTGVIRVVCKLQRHNFVSLRADAFEHFSISTLGKETELHVLNFGKLLESDTRIILLLDAYHLLL